MNFFGENLYKKARKLNLKEFDQFNKDYYRLIEDYDWVKVIKNFSGPESIYHKLREKTAMAYISLFISDKKNRKILDAGCGTGLILRHLPKNSVGIDINPRHIEKTKRNTLSNKIVLGDIEKTPFKKNTYDIVVCFETLEHLLFPEKALSEFKRILKKGGLFIGSVPRKSMLWYLRALSKSHPHNEPFHREFSEKEIFLLVSKSFKIQKIKKEIFGLNFFFVANA
ncbi:MAG: class I SAM-dependent methyltransferase [Candidatus Roizmanbacteria bacterium]|nr:MAG: class I SAM-dependent methyltransferase [Candidatus Roizmanbacteria bacterium]